MNIYRLYLLFVQQLDIIFKHPFGSGNIHNSLSKNKPTMFILEEYFQHGPQMINQHLKLGFTFYKVKTFTTILYIQCYT